MSVAGLYQAYKVWKQYKGAMKKVKGSGSYKILEISERLDKLVDEYRLWKMHRSSSALKIIREKLGVIQQDLVKLSMTTPDMPKIGKNVGYDAAYNVLDATTTAQMAQNELVRIAVEQLDGTLPEGESDGWPQARKRLLQHSEIMRKMAVGFRSQILNSNRDLREADALQDELDDIRKDPYMTPDQLDDLERDYKESLSHEAEIKTLQGRLSAMAQAADQAAANMDRYVELGDLARQAKKK